MQPEEEQAERAIDDFVKENVSCATCMFWNPMLFPGEGVCEGPEVLMGHMSDDTSMCEEHEFWDGRLQKQLEVLQDKHLKAMGF